MIHFSVVYSTRMNCRLKYGCPWLASKRIGLGQNKAKIVVVDYPSSAVMPPSPWHPPETPHFLQFLLSVSERIGMKTRSHTFIKRSKTRQNVFIMNNRLSYSEVIPLTFPFTEFFVITITEQNLNRLEHSPGIGNKYLHSLPACPRLFPFPRRPIAFQGRLWLLCCHWYE